MATELIKFFMGNKPYLLWIEALSIHNQQGLLPEKNLLDASYLTLLWRHLKMLSRL
jgi:hypothetical protein